MDKFNEQVIERFNFFTELYRHCDKVGGNLEHRQLPSKKQRFLKVADAATTELPEDQNNYFAVALRTGGGKKEDITEIPAVFADVDYKDIKSDEVERRLAQLPFKPTVRNSSGGGQHIYFRLKEPATKEDIPRVERVNRNLVSFLGGDKACVDASHILRIPGTPNLKYNPPRIVTTIEFNPEREFELAELERFFDHLYPAPEPKKPKADNGGGAIQPALDLPDQALIEKLLNANDGGKGRQLWGGDWSGYTSHSEGDQALCCKLAFYTRKDAARIDSLFRQSGLMRKKWNRDDYRQRTIERAIELTSEVYDPQRTCQLQPATSAPLLSTPEQARHYHLTDTGNGKRFADQHRENIRYCYPTSKWLAWDGTRWKVDSEGLVRQLAKQTTRGIYQEAAREPEPEKSSKIGKWAAASEMSFRQESMLKMAQSEPGIPILPEQMDTNHWLLNVQNGTIDLKTGELLPHRRSDLITKICPIDYDPDAECPKWLEYLYIIMGGDDEMVNYLCRVAGYTLTGDAGEQCLFIFHGSGQNGKSTYLNVMQSILDDYALQTGFDTFTVKKNEGIRNDIARMKTARLVVAIEAGDGKRIDEQVVKQLTGGDKVTARFLHQEHFEFRPQFKVVLAANHRPTIYDQNLAIWRRIRLIPFDVTISDAARINNYEQVLLEEKQGILNWMVFGCLEWQQAELATPEKVKVATEEYRSEMDVLEDFLDSHCTVGDGLKVTHGILYAAYEGWCEESKEAPFKTRTFAKMMQSRGFAYTKPHNVRTWQGIGIRS